MKSVFFLLKLFLSNDCILYGLPASGFGLDWNHLVVSMLTLTCLHLNHVTYFSDIERTSLKE